jgi:hypothetical protein
VADLAHELRRLADAAAGQAVPLPAAEVIRRGNLRRRRRTTRQAISVLAIAGVVTTVVLTGAATRIVGKTAQGPAAPAARSGCTLLVTTAVPAAHMTVCVSYAYDHGGDVQLQAVSASGRRRHLYRGSFSLTSAGQAQAASRKTKARTRL